MANRGPVLSVQDSALTELEIPNPQQAQRTHPVIVDRIRELAPTHTDRQIAVLLNQEGLVSFAGKSFTGDIVELLRRRHDIPTGCPEAPWMCPNGQRGDGRYSIRAAAKTLNVSESTISNWCLSGRLDSLQSVPGGPRWIKLTPEVITALRKPARQSRHSLR
jgi:hypothetical protein